MSVEARTANGVAPRSPLFGLLVSQTIGAFNDNAWKQVVALLGVAAAADGAAGQSQAAFAQVVLLVPLMIVSLPAGVLADRLSKRTVIVGMKWFEVVLMLLGAVALYRFPHGGYPALTVLGLLGVQAALFAPAKYGILPEILPHHRLSEGNGLLEMLTNVSIISGTIAGGVLISLLGGKLWVGALGLAGLSILGLVASHMVPRVTAARAEGGLVATVRLAWESIRSDRILALALKGQMFVWTVASLIPAPVLAYSSKVLGLDAWKTGLPLAALGLGIGLGCVIAGKISGAKVEYGLLPLGSLGLTLATFAFAATQPRLTGTLLLMGLMGVSSGLLFVPLNALIQWRAPDDRRGAILALTNVLVYAGMLVGSILAIVTAQAGLSPRGTFFGVSLALGVGFLWALWLVPDAFLRFLLVVLAHTFYRLRVLGREHVPATGPALLTPNHVSFADGLFIVGSTDRRVRFVVYAEYFRRPLMGFFLRSMRAIPIASSGGPKMILQAFREAGKALDDGQVVCIFPEGQITRNGLTQTFQRGLKRIVKGRNVPIIPVHLDRATASVFNPTHAGIFPERIPFPVTVSFGEPLPSTTPLHEIKKAVNRLSEQAWRIRTIEGRPLHHDFIRSARRAPWKLAIVDEFQPELSRLQALVRAIVIARALREHWRDQANVGILLPAGTAATLVNLSASIVNRAAVNLNFKIGSAALDSSARQAGLKAVVTARAFLERSKVEVPEGLIPIYLDEVGFSISSREHLFALLFALFGPMRQLEKYAGATRASGVEDVAAIIFSSGSTGEPKGVVLTHANLGSNAEAISQVFRTTSDDRILDVLPPFHAFGLLTIWLGLTRGLPLIAHPSPTDAATIGGLVERYRATILLATPTFLHIYLRRCAPAQFGSLRLVVVGAERLNETLARAFEDNFGVRALEGYGTTECSPVVAVSTPDFRAPGFFQPGSRRGYVGQPLPGVWVRVVDPGTGRELGPNEAGMVHVRGPNVMRGYLNRDDLTADVLQDGWYVTGDIGLLDEDGFLKITGRLSRFSKIGGEMVPHGRIEEALQEASGLDEPSFAVTAIADEERGEAIAVLTTADDATVEEALDGIRHQGLPNLFIPHRARFVRVAELPWLGSGKLDLRALRRIAEEQLTSPV